MICAVCKNMLEGRRGFIACGTPIKGEDRVELSFEHHHDRQSLIQSKTSECYICRAVCAALKQEEARDKSTDMPFPLFPQELVRAVSDATLWKANRQNTFYLNFSTSIPGFYRSLATFLLRETGKEADPGTYAPSSNTTGSSEVLQLAQQWIRLCLSQHSTCSDVRHAASKNKFYPRRIIRLPPYEVLESPDGLDKVVLIDTEHDHVEGEYVTLSHCWGGTTPLHLRNDNVDAFRRDGILLEWLPKTFQDAIDFATRLDPIIRYIWIDSLCIIQDDSNDWLKQSGQMFQIYRLSYCNLSATAASDSSRGIYYSRNPEHLVRNHVNLNTDGLPEMDDTTAQLDIHEQGPSIRQHSILNIASWERDVEAAAVNTRGWVLQERILAPRVIHFCKRQIAWECSHLTASESDPWGNTGLDLLIDPSNRIASWKKFLSSDVNSHSLTSVGSLDPETGRQRRAHECWTHIVQRFSKTMLTKAEDKLIALAGIAQLMSNEIPGRYIAGMWETYLASQLLWYVPEKDRYNKYAYPSSRPKIYRAPSFSWAAVDAPQGIICGYTIDEDELLIKVEHIHTKQQEDSKWGLIENDCYVEITCQLFEARMEPTQTLGQLIYFITWLENEFNKTSPLWPLYLDSPRDDFRETITRWNDKVYCVPVMITIQTNGVTIVDWLLLQELQSASSHFRRVGYGQVSLIDDLGEEFISKLDRQLQKIRIF